ncbi:protein tyrosine phosphatase [uncultured Tolumonas sp.]|uniref:arsenate reductase/protein-tyrosine-phosphatase family protein n=1 Tax=uncultured Tolumonas sp. TaxID=263765 RepID=UPI002A0A76DA|nr:protein tyrosine phosphatase [uncultured Tolumonas sp.]
MRFNSILVVCVGNICRSPTAERLLKQALPEKNIASAGISALVGNSADGSATEVAQAHALSLEGHVAQQLTRDLCQQYDLILVMEQKHIDAVTRIAPEARGKTMLYGHWLKRDIPDPYRQSREAFEFTFDLIAEASQAWAQRLNK